MRDFGIHIRKIIAVITVIFFSFYDISWSAQFAWNITIPGNVGKVNTIYAEKYCRDGQFITIVEDAHSDFGAQKNISGIIKSFNGNDFVVGLEGGVGKIKFSELGRYPFADIRERVTNNLIKRGLLTGGEGAVIKLGLNNVYGVEDEKIFTRAYTVYRELKDNEANINAFMKNAEYEIDIEKSKTYNDFLYAYDQKYCLYKTGKIELKEYILYLLRIAGGMDISDYPQILILKEIAEKMAADKLKNTDYLFSLLDISELLREIELFYVEIANRKLIKNISEKKLFERSMFLKLLKNILSIKATRFEKEEFFSCEEKTLMSFKEPRLRNWVNMAETFYTLTEKREEAIIKNMEKLLKDNNVKNGILVVGGYHILGIEEYLRRKHMSYRVISPNLSQDISYGNIFKNRINGRIFLRNNITAVTSVIRGNYGVKDVKELFNKEYVKEMIRNFSKSAALVLLSEKKGFPKELRMISERIYAAAKDYASGSKNYNQAVKYVFDSGETKYESAVKRKNILSGYFFAMNRVTVDNNKEKAFYNFVNEKIALFYPAPEKNGYRIKGDFIIEGENLNQEIGFDISKIPYTDSGKNFREKFFYYRAGDVFVLDKNFKERNVELPFLLKDNIVFAPLQGKGRHMNALQGESSYHFFSAAAVLYLLKVLKKSSIDKKNVAIMGLGNGVDAVVSFKSGADKIYCFDCYSNAKEEFSETLYANNIFSCDRFDTRFLGIDFADIGKTNLTVDTILINLSNINGEFSNKIFDFFKPKGEYVDIIISGGMDFRSGETGAYLKNLLLKRAKDYCIAKYNGEIIAFAVRMKREDYIAYFGNNDIVEKNSSNNFKKDVSFKNAPVLIDAEFSKNLLKPIRKKNICHTTGKKLDGEPFSPSKNRDISRLMNGKFTIKEFLKRFLQKAMGNKVFLLEMAAAAAYYLAKGIFAFDDKIFLMVPCFALLASDSEKKMQIRERDGRIKFFKRVFSRLREYDGLKADEDIIKIMKNAFRFPTRSREIKFDFLIKAGLITRNDFKIFTNNMSENWKENAGKFPVRKRYVTFEKEYNKLLEAGISKERAARLLSLGFSFNILKTLAKIKKVDVKYFEKVPADKTGLLRLRNLYYKYTQKNEQPLKVCKLSVKRHEKFASRCSVLYQGINFRFSISKKHDKYVEDIENGNLFFKAYYDRIEIVNKAENIKWVFPIDDDKYLCLESGDRVPEEIKIYRSDKERKSRVFYISRYMDGWKYNDMDKIKNFINDMKKRPYDRSYRSFKERARHIKDEVMKINGYYNYNMNMILYFLRKVSASKAVLHYFRGIDEYELEDVYHVFGYFYSMRRINFEKKVFYELKEIEDWHKFFEKEDVSAKEILSDKSVYFQTYGIYLYEELFPDYFIGGNLAEKIKNLIDAEPELKKHWANVNKEHLSKIKKKEHKKKLQRKILSYFNRYYLKCWRDLYGINRQWFAYRINKNGFKHLKIYNHYKKTVAEITYKVAGDKLLIFGQKFLLYKDKDIMRLLESYLFFKYRRDIKKVFYFDLSKEERNLVYRMMESGLLAEDGAGYKINFYKLNNIFANKNKMKDFLSDITYKIDLEKEKCVKQSSRDIVKSCEGKDAIYGIKIIVVEIGDDRVVYDAGSIKKVEDIPVKLIKKLKRMEVATEGKEVKLTVIYTGVRSPGEEYILKNIFVREMKESDIKFLSIGARFIKNLARITIMKNGDIFINGKVVSRVKDRYKSCEVLQKNPLNYENDVFFLFSEKMPVVGYGKNFKIKKIKNNRLKIAGNGDGILLVDWKYIENNEFDFFNMLVSELMESFNKKFKVVFYNLPQGKFDDMKNILVLLPFIPKLFFNGIEYMPDKGVGKSRVVFDIYPNFHAFIEKYNNRITAYYNKFLPNDGCFPDFFSVITSNVLRNRSEERFLYACLINLILRKSVDVNDYENLIVLFNDFLDKLESELKKYDNRNTVILNLIVIANELIGEGKGLKDIFDFIIEVLPEAAAVFKARGNFFVKDSAYDYDKYLSIDEKPFYDYLPWLMRHDKRVGRIAATIAANAGVRVDAKRFMKISFFHDIGKFANSGMVELSNSVVPLTKRNMGFLNLHPELSVEMINRGVYKQIGYYNGNDGLSKVDKLIISYHKKPYLFAGNEYFTKNKDKLKPGLDVFVPFVIADWLDSNYIARKPYNWSDDRSNIDLVREKAVKSLKSIFSKSQFKFDGKFIEAGIKFIESNEFEEMVERENASYCNDMRQVYMSWVRNNDAGKMVEALPENILRKLWPNLEGMPIYINGISVLFEKGLYNSGTIITLRALLSVLREKYPFYFGRLISMKKKIIIAEGKGVHMDERGNMVVAEQFVNALINGEKSIETAVLSDILPLLFDNSDEKACINIFSGLYNDIMESGILNEAGMDVLKTETGKNGLFGYANKLYAILHAKISKSQEEDLSADFSEAVSDIYNLWNKDDSISLMAKMLFFLADDDKDKMSEIFIKYFADWSMFLNSRNSEKELMKMAKNAFGKTYGKEADFKKIDEELFAVSKDERLDVFISDGLKKSRIIKHVEKILSEFSGKFFINIYLHDENSMSVDSNGIYLCMEEEKEGEIPAGVVRYSFTEGEYFEKDLYLFNKFMPAIALSIINVDSNFVVPVFISERLDEIRTFVNDEIAEAILSSSKFKVAA